MSDEAAEFKPQLKLQVVRGGSGKPPGRTAIGSETPEPEAPKPRPLAARHLIWPFISRVIKVLVLLLALFALIVIPLLSLVN